MSKKIHNPKSFAPAVYITCWLIQVPNKKLSYAAKILYGRIAQWSSSNGVAFRSYNQLAEEIGSTQRSINEYLRELRECGLLETFQPQKGGLNHFEFYDHEWMHAPISDKLCYKSPEDPEQDSALPQAGFCSTPKQDSARINNKEIKRNKRTTISESIDSPATTKTKVVSKNQEFKKELIEKYHEVFPDNPKHMTELIAKDLDKALSVFIDNYPLINKNKEKLTVQLFEAYLQKLKQSFPQWTMQPYKTDSGRMKKNSLVTFVRMENVGKILEGRMS